MHPDVCRLISEMVYDARLEPEPHTINQVLLLNADAHPALASTGVRFVPVHHAACSQQSEEEAELIKTLIENLLQQNYQDKDKQVRPVTLENILVVAPYNMQVNLLKRVLPSGARVGTVDKFQGQQAEVVVVSMTTSNEEYLPRFIDFLYSKNQKSGPAGGQSGVDVNHMLHTGADGVGECAVLGVGVFGDDIHLRLNRSP